MTGSIDLNADMGEYADANGAKIEADLMALISSCSIACGGHAGDAETMRQTVQLAKAHHVSVGAHPSYPDRDGFGRRSIDIDRETLAASLREQIDALQEILDAEKISMQHVKPHGVLYNDAARDAMLAQLIAEISKDAVIVGPPDSALEAAARMADRPFIAEGFVDRLYRSDRSLTPRSSPGAVITDIEARAAQAAAIASGAEFASADGPIKLNVQTLCIHSDSPGAAETARAARNALTAAGFSIAAFAPAPA